MENRRLLRQLGDNVRRIRKDRGLSLAEVSSRMTALGVPLSLNGLSKVELGNRDVGLDELTALAAALGVPPVLLVFALGHERVVELFPGTAVDTWEAVKWFTGEQAFPTSVAGAEWIKDARLHESPTSYFRDHDRMLNELMTLVLQLAAARNQGRPDLALALDRSGYPLEYLEQTVPIAQERLVLLRATMRNAGLDPGDLPPALAHIEA